MDEVQLAEAQSMVGVQGAPPAGGGGQASPTVRTDMGGQATADAGTGGESRYGTLTSEEKATLRQTLATAHPDAIPELIGGETVGAMVASLETAKAAYQRTITAIKAATPVAAGGGGRPVSVDVSKLSPLAKISMGLREGQGKY